MSTKEIQEKLIANMRRWQKIEDAATSSTGQMIEKTDNPVLKLVMEIIQRDSQIHRRVQGLVADSLEKSAITMTPEDMAGIWDLVEKHIEIEKQTVELARSSLSALKGRKMLIQEYLLNYLMEDEHKHEQLLERLNAIKRGMYPYG